jgi:hypothetical protein
MVDENIKAMVDAAADGNLVDFRKEFNSGIIPKVSGALDNKRMEVAGTFLNKIEVQQDTEDNEEN